MQAQPFSPLCSPGCAPCEALRPTPLFLPALQSTLGRSHYLRARVVVAQTFIPASHPLVHCQDCSRGAALLAVGFPGWGPQWSNTLNERSASLLCNLDQQSSDTVSEGAALQAHVCSPFSASSARCTVHAVSVGGSVIIVQYHFPPSLLLGSLFVGPVPLIHQLLFQRPRERRTKLWNKHQNCRWCLCSPTGEVISHLSCAPSSDVGKGLAVIISSLLSKASLASEATKQELGSRMSAHILGNTQGWDRCLPRTVTATLKMWLLLIKVEQNSAVIFQGNLSGAERAVTFCTL